MNLLQNILLVDDDEDDLLLIQEALTCVTNEFIFTKGNDGRSALNYLKSARSENKLPSLIILDINMPILDGREVLAIIKSEPQLKLVPVVMFTTSSNPSDIEYCKQFGVTLFTKPFDLNGYRETAKNVLSYCQSM